MLLYQKRKHLLEQKMLRTDIARELYNKYYYLLFEFAKDLVNSNVREIVIRDDAVVITTRREGIMLHCPEGETTSALGQLILAGTENDEQEMMAALFRKMIEHRGGNNANVVFFDIGANIGWYSILFDKLFPGLHIHAFEPIQFACEQLKKNMALNQSGPVHVNSFGLADRNETIDFFVSPSSLAASSLADTCKTSDKIKLRGQIRRLDDYCRENSVSPDFIKCDVEGAELLVFRGADQVLYEAKPIVMAELLRKWAKCFNYHPNDVIALFRQHDYSCFVVTNGALQPFGFVTDETIETNYFFLHNQAHQYLLASELISSS